MDKKNVEDKVKEILARKVGIDKEKITLQSNLVDNLGVDSFTSIELIFELEDAMGIGIPEKDVIGLITVDDVVSYVFSRISKENTRI